MLYIVTTEILTAEADEQLWTDITIFFFFFFLRREKKLANIDKITQKLGARVLGGDCCRSAVT